MRRNAAVPGRDGYCDELDSLESRSHGVVARKEIRVRIAAGGEKEEAEGEVRFRFYFIDTDYRSRSSYFTALTPPTHATTHGLATSGPTTLTAQLPPQLLLCHTVDSAGVNRVTFASP